MKYLLVYTFTIFILTTRASWAVDQDLSAILNIVENHQTAFMIPRLPPTFADRQVIADARVATGNRSHPLEPTSSLRSGDLSTATINTTSLSGYYSGALFANGTCSDFRLGYTRKLNTCVPDVSSSEIVTVTADTITYVDYSDTSCTKRKGGETFDYKPDCGNVVHPTSTFPFPVSYVRTR